MPPSYPSRAFAGVAARGFMFVQLNPPSRGMISVDGQIVLALADGPLQATEIYTYIRASQPTVSRRLGHLLKQGVLSMRQVPDDRRCTIYTLNPLSMWQGVGAADIEAFAKLASLISTDFAPDNCEAQRGDSNSGKG